MKKDFFKKTDDAAHREIKRCNLIRDFNERLSCKAKLLHEVTKVQDHVNLDVMSDFFKSDPACSKDKRWQPVHIVDNANAIILGISSREYNPEAFWYEGSYVEEKANSLSSKLWMLPKGEW